MPAGYPITDYRPEELVAIVTWISSDTLLRTREQLLSETMSELGFQRRGARIETAIIAAIDEAARRRA